MQANDFGSKILFIAAKKIKIARERRLQPPIRYQVSLVEWNDRCKNLVSTADF